MIDKHVIIFGDDPRLNTGFSRIVNRLVSAVKKAGCVPLVVGLKPYNGNDIYNNAELVNLFKSYPNDTLGGSCIKKMCKDYNVAAVISVGDPWDIRGVADAKEELGFYWIGYTPVESIPYPRYLLINARAPLQYLDVGHITSKIDHIVTYSEFGIKAVADMLTIERKIETLPPITNIYLGVDKDLYKPFDKEQSRSIMQGINKDDILFMCNKANSPRVGYEVLLSAWKKLIIKANKTRPTIAKR